MKVKGTFETKRGLPSGAVSRRVKLKIVKFENRFCDIRNTVQRCAVFLLL